MAKKNIQLVEIARSFSYSNKEYGKGSEFFCSQKAECHEKDAEKTSEALYQFCKSQVLKSLNEWVGRKANNEVDYAKGFEAGMKEAMNPNADRKEMYEKKNGKDPSEKKEVMAELEADNKAEEPY